MMLYKFEIKKCDKENRFAEFDGLVLYEPDEESAKETALGLSGEYGLFDPADYTLENVGEFIEFAGSREEWHEAVLLGDFISCNHDADDITTTGAALCCGTSIVAARKWASKNNVKSVGAGNRKMFLWQEKDLLAFAARNKKRGRRAMPKG